MSEIAFVAGATGFVGREVVRALAQSGVDVHAHVRPDSSRLAQWRSTFTAAGASVDTTAWDAEAMTARLVQLQPTAVFGLLGTTRKRARNEGIDDPYERVDYGLTALLIDACVAAEITPRFVYLSAAGVSGGSRGAYMKARWKAEQALRKSGLPYSIARPSFITGPGRDDNRPGERVGAVVADAGLRVASLLGGRKLRSRYRSTSNTVLGEALARIAFDPATANRVLDGDDIR